LLQAGVARPFRPQAIAAALTSLQPGQVDAALIFFHSMGLVFDGDLPAALARHADAMATPSIFLERRTLLLQGCLLGSNVFDACPTTDPVARDEVRARVHPWLVEASNQEYWSPSEMVSLYETAMFFGATDVAVPMGHKWFSLAPADYRVRLAHVEVLMLEGAIERADALLVELEANQSEANAAAKVRLADVRAAIDRLQKK
jgi:hypothetical protein